MQAYLQAIINLDMYIRGGGGAEKIINRDKLQSLSLQNHQYAQGSYYICISNTNNRCREGI